MRIDYAELDALDEGEAAASHELSITTRNLCICLLELAHNRAIWRNGDDPLTDAEWDIVDEWIGIANNELM